MVILRYNECSSVETLEEIVFTYDLARYYLYLFEKCIRIPKLLGKRFEHSSYIVVKYINAKLTDKEIKKMSKDREQGQVATQICELSGVLGEMDDTISQLESRLDSVLCGREIGPSDEIVEKAMELVPLANDLRNKVNGFREQLNRLHELRRRVEL